MSSVLIDDHIY